MAPMRSGVTMARVGSAIFREPAAITGIVGVDVGVGVVMSKFCRVVAGTGVAAGAGPSVDDNVATGAGVAVAVGVGWKGRGATAGDWDRRAV